MDSLRKSRLELPLLVAVVLVAVVLRFYALDQVEFQWDQAEISKWGLTMARERQVTWIGTWSSTRLDTFPLAIWLMAIPYALSTSPVFATGFVALLNTLAVVGGYFLARAWFGKRAALIATFLYAVAPWAVIYSRKIWHTVLLPPFILLYVATAWLAFVKRKRWAVVAHCLALTALVQIHFSSFAFIPLTGLWLLLFARRIDWRLVFLGGLLSALTFVPYFVIDAQNDWRNAQLFSELIGSPAVTDTEAIRAGWTISTGLGLEQLTGADRFGEFVARAPDVRVLFVIGGGLVVLAVIAALWMAASGARRGLGDEQATVLILVTWLAAPILFLTRHNTGVAHHYLTTTFPAQFMLIGWLVTLLWRRPQRLARVARWGMLGLVLMLAVAQGYQVFSLLRFLETHDTHWGYGTPLAYELEAVQTTARIGDERGAEEVILLSEGDEPRMYEMPAVADVLLLDEPHRAVDVARSLVIPDRPVVYWTTRDVTRGEELLQGLVPELVAQRIPLREGVHSFRFYHWPGGELSLPDMVPLDGGPVVWANGVRLRGYWVDCGTCAAGSFRWTLVWSPTEQPSEDINYHWFNHLLDAQGNILAQADGPSLLPTSWRSGDTVLNWFDIELPPDQMPEQFQMRVGMYAYPTMENIATQQPDGEPAGDWFLIELPLSGEVAN